MALRERARRERALTAAEEASMVQQGEGRLILWWWVLFFVAVGEENPKVGVINMESYC